MTINMETFGETPDEDHNLWRYTSFAKLLNILNEDDMDIIAYRAKKLDDDYEGTLSERAKTEIQDALLKEHLSDFENEFNNSRNKYTRPAVEDMRESYSVEGASSKSKCVENMVDKMREVTFANCWSDRRYEDSNMWGAYTSESDGVAIKTTYGSMKDSILEVEGLLYCGNVEYIDFDNQDMKRDAIAPFYYKQQQFESESEFRLIVTDYDSRYFNLEEGVDGIPSPPEKPKRPITVDPNELIEEVRVHPKSKDYFKDVVEEALEAKGVTAPVIESSLRPSLS